MALRKRDIILSPQAENDLEKIYAYLAEEWGETVLTNFVATLNDFLFIVAYHPRMFAYINKNLN
ncbi:MAG: type II toxin-antitoxin system RelE/ParE family toxin [Pedobacter sp.]|nr:type II toxin-antitoxin system RelE/ParE family toxin [Chitinophagaceae bacterium]